MDEQRTLLTPAQVAARLQIKERTILDWLRDGKLVGVKVGRVWRIYSEALAMFLERADPR